MLSYDHDSETEYVSYFDMNKILLSMVKIFVCVCVCAVAVYAGINDVKKHSTIQPSLSNLASREDTYVKNVTDRKSVVHHFN